MTFGQPESHETLHESPLLRALSSLPKKFTSVHEWAEIAKRHGVPLVRCKEEPEKTGNYLFNYSIATSKGFVFFGAYKDTPHKLVVGKRPFSPYEIPVSVDTDPVGGDFNAMKQISDRYANDAAMELDALEKLCDNMDDSTPYCVKLLDSISYQYTSVGHLEVPLLVMEFVAPGEDLQTFYENSIGNNALTEFRTEFAAAAGLQIVRALCSLKKIGLVHRDIKPENIMVQNPHGNLGFIVLTDFNAAIPVEDFNTSKTRASPTIVPPEQLLTIYTGESERKPYDPHSIDLYGLGCVLFYLCTGTYPYRGSTLNEVQSDMLSAPEERPAHELKEAGVKRELGELIVKLLDFADFNRGDLKKLQIELEKIVAGGSYAELIGDLHDDSGSISGIQKNVTTGSQVATDGFELWRHGEDFGKEMVKTYPGSRGFRRPSK